MDEIVIVREIITETVEVEGDTIIAPSTVDVIVVSSDFDVITEAQQGPPGPPGPQGNAALQFSFAYGDASPVELFTALADKLITAVSIFMEQAFNGAGAALSVGTIAQPDALLTTSENNPASTDVFHVSPNRSFGVDTTIQLFITPGAGASQGRGMVTIEIEQ